MSRLTAQKVARNETKLDLNGTGWCASFNFRKAARAVTRLYDQAFQKVGIRSTQFGILIAVAKKQPISIGALAELLVMDQTTLTRSLRLLKNEKLISVSDRSTMRQRFVCVTPQGEKVLWRCVDAWRKAQERFVAAVGYDYWTNLRNELEKVARVAVALERSGSESRVIPFNENR
jgi:DNA-binding MarR family transcriptional regulator